MVSRIPASERVKERLFGPVVIHQIFHYDKEGKLESQLSISLRFCSVTPTISAMVFGVEKGKHMYGGETGEIFNIGYWSPVCGMYPEKLYEWTKKMGWPSGSSSHIMRILLREWIENHEDHRLSYWLTDG